MTTTLTQNAVIGYKKAITAAWYRIPGLDKLNARIAADRTLTDESRDELSKLIARRITVLVDARMATVDEL